MFVITDHEQLYLWFLCDGHKKQKIGKPQPFFWRFYMDIFIFWCTKMARWKKFPPFRVVPKLCVLDTSWYGSGVSGSVCLSLLVSVNTWCSLYEGTSRDIRECILGTNQFVLVIKCPQVFFEGPVYALSAQAGKQTILAQPWKKKIFFTLPLSKCPWIVFTKLYILYCTAA